MQQSTKKKKFKWLPIFGPNEFKTVEVGETLVMEPKDAIGKILEIDLGTLTGDSKRQSMNVILRITDFKDEKLNTEILGCALMSSYVRRLTKSTKSKIELSFPVKTKDQNLRIKPIIILKHKTIRSIQTSISNKVQELIKEKLSTLDFIQVLDAVVSLRLQKELQKELSKIYPIGILLVKSLKIEKKE